jgi:hypothetical protein
MAPIISTFGSGSARGFGGGFRGNAVPLPPGSLIPIFAVKIVDGSNDGNIDFAAGQTGNTEDFMRAALSLDSSSGFASPHDENTSLTTILSQADNSGASVFDAVRTDTTLLFNAYQINYHNTTNTSPDRTAFFETGSAHLFYNDIANAQSNLHPNKVPAAVGGIVSAESQGNAISTANVLINASLATSRSGDDFWSSDNSDYCFMGVFNSMQKYTGDSDTIDTNTSFIEIALGISDSDGAPTSGQPPRAGISRRSQNYPSLVTVNGFSSSTQHSGNTTNGFVVLYGRIA